MGESVRGMDDRPTGGVEKTGKTGMRGCVRCDAVAEPRSIWPASVWAWTVVNQGACIPPVVGWSRDAGARARICEEMATDVHCKTMNERAAAGGVGTIDGQTAV